MGCPEAEHLARYEASEDSMSETSIFRDLVMNGRQAFFDEALASCVASLRA